MKRWVPEAALSLLAERPHLVMRETVVDDLLNPLFLGAVFSPITGDGKEPLYRYLLWRVWDLSLQLLVVIMLNPSTADHEKNDQTISGLIVRARALGYGGLLVLNCFALRASDPKIMKRHAAPIGPDNDAAIGHTLSQKPEMVLCGWGIDGVHLDREAQVKWIISRHGAKAYALRLCANGAPGHPLYIAQDTRPFELSITIMHNVNEATLIWQR